MAAGYNTKGERLVAGVVPLSSDLQYVLLIQSDRRKGWVLPKGGWESDEECAEAAAREAWEEAGIIIQIDYDLGDIIESRPPKSSSKSSKKRDKALYRFYQATVLSDTTNDMPAPSAAAPVYKGKVTHRSWAQLPEELIR